MAWTGVVVDVPRGPKDHINIRILRTMISGIILGLLTRMSDPYVYVVFWAPSFVVA